MLPSRSLVSARCALFDVVEKHLPTVHCYADDSQLYISFSPKAHSSQADAVASIEHCIQDIRRWMSQDKLLMNDAKTELLLIGTRPVSYTHLTLPTIYSV